MAPSVRLERSGTIAYREADAGRDGAPAALFVHGYPTSSHLWREILPAAAEAGYRAVAPDLPGFGDSAADLPGTWERQVETLERFRRDVGLDRLVLCVHDWGGLIGLRWACDNPGAVSGLVISDTGFFPDGRWHGFANVLRSEEGDAVMANMTRELFAGAVREVSDRISDATVDEFWKAYSEADRRQSQLDLYRSGDFSKLEAYKGKLTALGVPALILWGEDDQFAPVAGAYRFRKELPGAELVLIEGAGHFLQEDAPERVASEIRDFLARHRGEARAAGD